MKGKIAALALLTAAGISTATFAEDGDGKINFEGNIIEAGCQTNSTLTSPITVHLGDVAKTDFAAPGDTAADSKFTLVLTDCPDTLKGKNVVVKYEGTPDAVENDYLELTDYGNTGVASGVAIQLLNSDNSPLALGADSKTTTIDATGGASMDFFARYIATSTPVGAGTANGTVNFTLSYN